jgi:hypothetical protein
LQSDIYAEIWRVFHTCGVGFSFFILFLPTCDPTGPGLTLWALLHWHKKSKGRFWVTFPALKVLLKNNF